MFPKGILQTLEREYNRDSPFRALHAEGDTRRVSDPCVYERYRRVIHCCDWRVTGNSDIGRGL
jgi:hypothetical protein